MQTVIIAGTQTTSVTVTDPVTVVQGYGPDVSTLRASSSAGPIVLPYNPANPVVIDHLIVRDLTLDANGFLNALVASVYTLKKLTVRNVRLVNYTQTGISANACDVDAADVEFLGAGKAAQVSGSKSFRLERFTVGPAALGGFIKSDDAGTAEILLRDGVINLDFWEKPGHETTATVSGLVVTPAVMPTTPGLYSQVRMLDAAGRVVVGRVMGWTATTLNVQRWRYPDCSDAVAPPDGPCRVIHRYADVGGVHITAGGRAVIERVTVRGGWADMITVRGSGCYLADCRVSHGQDMGYTVDGNHRLVRCHAEHVNFDGFTSQVAGGGALYDCCVGGNRAGDFSAAWAPWGVVSGCRSL